ncbi:MAG: hypothetical protein JJE03_07730 [Peptostreptococcaceae bacterium]|nr:hypothetical protein [Peptostreptococcaceae bacterium]
MEKNKLIQKCPICGCTVHEKREWHQCRQFNKPVCMECCQECEYNLNGALSCSYGRGALNINDEISKLSHKRDSKERKMRYMYKNHKPHIASKYEAEADFIGKEIRRLERDINEN